ncbi:MAG TPA: PAS domain-containing protein [Chthoniobacteraceae bacterium]|jgi:PAS domain S-box-containing protein
MDVITQQLQEQAASYAAGALTAPQRAQFELVLEFREDVREIVNDLQELTAAATIATQDNQLRPSAALKARIMGLLDDRVQQTREPGFVMTTPDGLVNWVNPAFSAMCGYSLEELQGRKLGPLLQGPLTDPAAVERVRQAIGQQQPCSEALINYHKNGQPYWVSINITPIHDADGEVLWFAAREMELPERFVEA